MRVKRKRTEWVILAVAVIAIGVFAGASPEGTSRLVSVQQLPANMDACANFDQPSAADASAATSPQEERLLASLGEEPSFAPSPLAEPPQREGDVAGGGSFALPNTTEQLRVTADLRAKGARVPVRTIRDTAPTYSSIAVEFS